MITEQSNPLTQNIDRLSTMDMLQLINEEDQKVALAVQKVLDSIARAVDGITERLQNGGRLVYVGAGTSGRLGVLDAVECIPTYNTPPELVQAIIAGGSPAITRSVEGAEDDRKAAQLDLAVLKITSRDAVVGIAASGRTPYVLEAVSLAKSTGSLTVGIACNVPSALLDAVDIAIGVEVGPEVIAGSTRMKAGTAQKLILNMLSTGTMIKLGKVYGNLMVDVQPTNQKLIQRAINLVAKIAGVDQETASKLFRDAGQNVKVAIVTHRRQVDANTARELLAQSSGRLRDVIG